MNKTELLKLIDSEWEKKVHELEKEFYDLFGVKNGALPENPEWKGWVLGLTEGIHRAYGDLYRKINNDMTLN